MAEVDLRLLRYFVAVAEERSFTRAAGRLPMTQGALSRAVRALEAVVGAPLLVRGHRQITLTEAGQVLLRQARDLDRQAVAAIRLARCAATRPPQLAVASAGYDVAVLDELVCTYNIAYGATRLPAVALIVDHQELSGRVREGIADVALIRDVFDSHGLDSDELLREPRVVLLPDTHLLAGADELELRQLEDAPVIGAHRGDEAGVLLWSPDQLRTPTHGAAPLITDTWQIRAFVRLGHGVAFVPESIGATLAGEGIRAVRVRDCPPSTLRVVWRHDSTSPAIASLVSHATANLDARNLDPPSEMNSVYARSDSSAE